jgi:8-oxo-dGTP pyrophosphatase MutT (NUDIX family)
MSTESTKSTMEKPGSHPFPSPQTVAMQQALIEIALEGVTTVKFSNKEKSKKNTHNHKAEKKAKKPKITNNVEPKQAKLISLPEPLPISDDPQFPILKGCGIVNYRFEKGQIHFLMMRKNGKLDIPGGKLERGIDKNSVDTAVREFNEETKCQAYLYLIGNEISELEQKTWTQEKWKQVQSEADDFLKPIVKDCPILVAQQPAWGVYLVELPFIPTEIFPKFEDEILGFQGQEYQMEWVRLWDFLDRWQLCGRLSSLNFTGAIRQIHARYESAGKMDV